MRTRIFVGSILMMLIAAAAFAEGNHERTLSLYGGWNVQSPSSLDATHYPYTGVEGGLSYRFVDGPSMDVLFRGHYDMTWPGDSLFGDTDVRNTALIGVEFLNNDHPIGFACGIGWRLLQNTATGDINQYGVWGEIFTYSYPAHDQTWFRIDPYAGIKIIGGFGASLGIRLRFQPY